MQMGAPDSLLGIYLGLAVCLVFSQWLPSPAIYCTIILMRVTVEELPGRQAARFLAGFLGRLEATSSPLVRLAWSSEACSLGMLDEARNRFYSAIGGQARLMLVFGKL